MNLNGLKITKNRLLVYNYIKDNNKVLLKDIINNLNIDQSTIYRIINKFIEYSIINKNIINNEVYFILNDNHKHYIKCSKCNKLEELKECPYKDLDNVKIEEKEILDGICSNCCK